MQSRATRANFDVSSLQRRFQISRFRILFISAYGILPWHFCLCGIIYTFASRIFFLSYFVPPNSLTIFHFSFGRFGFELELRLLNCFHKHSDCGSIGCTVRSVVRSFAAALSSAIHPKVSDNGGKKQRYGKCTHHWYTHTHNERKVWGVAQELSCQVAFFRLHFYVPSLPHRQILCSIRLSPSLPHASHSSCTTSDCRPFISVWTFSRRKPFCRWKTNGKRRKPWINFGEPNWAVCSLRPNRCFNPTITISHFREFDFFLFFFSDGGRKTETISNERRWTTAEFRGNDSKSE